MPCGSRLALRRSSVAAYRLFAENQRYLRKTLPRCFEGKPEMTDLDVLIRDKNGLTELRSYRRKWVTAGIGKAAYRGGA